jgi:hypothetical protein
MGMASPESSGSHRYSIPPGGLAAAVAVLTEQRVGGQFFVGVDIALPQRGIGLGGGEQPLEVGFEPVDEGCAQRSGVGNGLGDLRLGLEDALALSVVQIGDLRGFAEVGHGGQGVAIRGVVAEAAQAVAGEVAVWLAI